MSNVRLFGATLRETIGAYRNFVGTAHLDSSDTNESAEVKERIKQESKTALEDLSKAIMRMIVSLVILGLGVKLSLDKNVDMQKYGNSLLSVLLGYWLK